MFVWGLFGSKIFGIIITVLTHRRASFSLFGDKLKQPDCGLSQHADPPAGGVVYKTFT